MEEIRSLTHVEMTHEKWWDPSRVGGCHRSREEEEHRKIIASVQIDQQTIRAKRPEDRQLTYGEAEYDILLASCSPVYSERTLIQRLVASVRITSCYEDDDEDSLMNEAGLRTIAAVDTRARHTALSVEEVSRKYLGRRPWRRSGR